MKVWKQTHEETKQNKENIDKLNRSMLSTGSSDDPAPV